MISLIQIALNFTAAKRGQAAANQQPDPGVVTMASIADFRTAKQLEPATITWLNDCVARGKREIFSSAVRMNPGVAAELLRRNPANRPVKWKVANYATDMSAGHWALNGEPVIISQDGLVNDGQNRMLAIIDSNTTQDMLFVFGIVRETRTTVDQGVARSAGDYMGMEGAKNAHNLAAITKGVIAFEQGDYKRLDNTRITPAMILEREKRDGKTLNAACDYAIHVYRSTRAFASPKVVGMAFYLLSNVNPFDAVDYLDKVCLGESIKRGDPAFAAREALINMGPTSVAAKVEMIFRGWNAFRTHRPLKMAKVFGSFPALV